MNLKKYLKQTSVYWEKRGSDPRGLALYNAPVEVMCRWEDKSVQVVDPEMRVITFDAYLMFNQNIIEGSLLYLGTLEAVKLKVQFPTVLSIKQGAREVKRVNRIPDLRGRPLLFEVFL